MDKITGDYSFETPLVGESNYTTAIRKCYNDKKSYKKGRSAFLDVQLHLDDDNSYDNKAVVCASAHGILGYLSKENARVFRVLILKTPVIVKAKIYLNPDHKDGFGIWLDIDLDDDTVLVDSINKEKNNHVKQPKKSSLENNLDGIYSGFLKGVAFLLLAPAVIFCIYIFIATMVS